MNCPNGHGTMKTNKIDRKVEFRDMNLSIKVDLYKCNECGLEAGNADQTAKIQRTISDAYRKKTGLLTSVEIRAARKRMGLTQSDLADQLRIGIASIKRWERGLIQTKSMDKALRTLFWNEESKDSLTGKRTLSLPRTKLVLKYCEKRIRKDLLIENDKLLYAAKYVWYADMVAFRDLGKGMTGATYAALPYGPQLNNYRELVDNIISSCELDAEPLTDRELNILNNIAKTFPNKRAIYSAAHNENIWKNKDTGEIIPYSDAYKLKEI